MSAKRQATTDLNHDNWNEPYICEEKGEFKQAPKDILEKRVIRTAKRRSIQQAKTEVFNSFTGFNKSAPTSFDFLSKLTSVNGENKPNGSSNQSINASVDTDITTSSSNNILKPSINTLSTFNSPNSNTVVSSSESSNMLSSSNSLQKSPETLIRQGSSTSTNTFLMGMTKKNQNEKDVLKENCDLFKIPKSPGYRNSSCETGEISANEKKFYQTLQCLNKSVLAWIKQHVDEDPICILTPIFKDYEKHLHEIEKVLDKNKVENLFSSDKTSHANAQLSKQTDFQPKAVSTPAASSFNKVVPSTPFNFGINNANKSSNITSTNPSFSFGVNTNKSESAPVPSSTVDKKPSNTVSPTPTSSLSFGSPEKSQITPNTNKNFNNSTVSLFGSSNSTLKPTDVPPSNAFSFGIKSTPNTADDNLKPSSLFSFGPSAAGNFSFGSNASSPINNFSFADKIQQQNTEKTEDGNEEEDQPPKVEYKPIIEDNSVYDKKCKIFFKKDSTFVDKGVGTLYIKTVENSSKHQLMVRANTAIGNVLLNLILSDSTPLQKTGKNNVMLVCIPTSDAQPPPIPVLIRVKTSEEADELLETLKKYRG